ncbi:MAG: nitroreductase family protein [Methylovirgula sp.]|nr:nitroreductase family protein [Methylovirgula sp.]
MRVSYVRREVRNYADAPVAQRVLEALIAAAIEAPGACCEQPWHFTVIRNQPLLDRISAAAKVHLLSTIGGNPGRMEVRQYLLSPEFQIFYHAPVVILISARSDEQAFEEASVVAQNLMLAAREFGLSTCWIDFARNWLETHEGRRSIALPAGYQPIAPIIIGRPHATTLPAPCEPPIIKWID